MVSDVPKGSHYIRTSGHFRGREENGSQLTDVWGRLAAVGVFSEGLVYVRPYLQQGKSGMLGSLPSRFLQEMELDS